MVHFYYFFIENGSSGDNKDPTTLFISYLIVLMFFVVHIFLRARLRAHHPRYPKILRMMVLHNTTHCHASVCIVGYDLHYIFIPNLINLLNKSIHNVVPVFSKSLNIHGVREHRSTLIDWHNINNRSPLCPPDHPSLRMEIPSYVPVLLIGSNNMS